MDPERKKQFMTATNMSKELFMELRVWCSEGHRSVDIDMKNSDYTDDHLRIFVYDHDIGDGKHISGVEEIPDKKEALMEKLKYAEERVNQLKQKLEKE